MNINNEAKQIIKALGLEPLPIEGGYFKEMYQSKEQILTRTDKERKLYSTIYYLITTETFSALHRLPGDEIFHFYKGGAVEMFHLTEGGKGSMVTLGSDIIRGEIPQFCVKGGVWQGCRLKEGGSYALMGTSMSPGFDYEDYQHGERAELLHLYPEHQELIKKYTRGS